MLHKKFLPFLLFFCFFAIYWPSLSSAATARDKYYLAERCYKKLRCSLEKQKYRHNWLFCVKKFESVYKHDPSGPWAAAGLYMAGCLYSELYKRSCKKSDLQESLDIFQRIINLFPKSRYKEKAEAKINAITKKQNKKRGKTKIKKKSTSTKGLNKKNLKRSTNKRSSVTGLRFWSNPSYTRVVIDATRETSYTHRLLKKDPSINKPKRLYIDLNNCKLAKDIKKIIPINDDLLIDTRAGQYHPDVVRVVIDIKSYKTYNIFSLKNPFRIVIDVWGTYPKKHSRYNAKTKTGIEDSAIVKQFALGVQRIIIDPGHGGRDYGAPGYFKGVHEKEITLQIARKLAQKIRKELHCETILTRKTDRYLTLEERTAFANTKNADLFISIHTNATKNKGAYGIETYFLNLATDDDAILVAARENATSKKNISDLQVILNDLMQNAKINESSRLAAHIQDSVCGHMKKRYSKIRSIGVKQAPFYVLLGAQMPAILIEASFISNKRDCKRLTNSKYQDDFCYGVVKGIKEYIKEINLSSKYSPR